MTQKDLAEGICVQAMISKIENNELIPRHDKLEKLANRLNIPLEYFSENISNPKKESTESVDINGVIKVIREQLTKREYDSVFYLVEAYQREIQNLSNEREILFFKWIKATLHYHKHKDSNEALEMLKAIPLSDNEIELSIEIINAIGRMYYIREEYEKAIQEYEKGMAYSLNKEVSDFTIRVKLLFNYSLALVNKEEYREALEVINTGIDMLVEKQSLYLLGDLYYQKGIVFRHYNNTLDAKRCYLNAYSLFDIQKNEKFKNLTQLELNEIADEGGD